MSDCCASSCATVAAPRKQRCPECGRACAEVSMQTMLHHLVRPWRREDKAQQYYFCDTPDCEVVYFAADGTRMHKADVRTVVGSKETSPAALLCYCFGVSRADAATEPQAWDYVVRQTRAGLCSCATRNPSGRCCLKDLPLAAEVPSSGND